MKFDDRIRTARENKSVTWYAECPQCGNTVSEADEGKPCPSGCMVQDRKGFKTRFIITKDKLNIRYAGLSMEEIQEIRETPGEGPQ